MGNARSVIKRLRFPLDIMLLCVRWYIAYPLSLRNLDEMMQERGLFVDHSTIHGSVALSDARVKVRGHICSAKPKNRVDHAAVADRRSAYGQPLFRRE
jgi:transposase-like protein